MLCFPPGSVWVVVGCGKSKERETEGGGLEASVHIDSVYSVSRGSGPLWVLQESQVQISHALPGHREQGFEAAYQVFSLWFRELETD